MESTQNLLSADLQVDPIASVHLKETAMWAKFLAILGLVFSILIGIAGLFAGSLLANMSKSFGGNNSMNPVNPVSTGMVMIFYLFIAAVYFFLSLFLYKFATKMKMALLTNDQEHFNLSLMNLKFVYRFMGIIAIINVSIVVLVFVVAVIAAAFMK